MTSELPISPSAPEEAIYAAQRLAQRYMPRDYEIGPISVASIDWPCNELSGDFLTVRRLSDDQIGFLIGDVMGHGIAAWGAANVMVSNYRLLCQQYTHPAELAYQLSRLTGSAGIEGPLPMVTAIIGAIDYARQVAMIVNAGHPTPYILDPAREEIWEFPVNEPLLGMMPEYRYFTLEMPFVPGQSLLFYTDGLLEACNETGESFEKTFQALVPAMLRQPSADRLPLLRQQLGNFLRSAVPKDDVLVTMLNFLEATASTDVAPTNGHP